MRMISSRRIGLAVFAVSALLAVGGCGSDDDEGGSASTAAGESGTTEATGSADVSKQCKDEGMAEMPYAVQGPGVEPDTVRMAYASGGSITPCAARLQGDKLVLLVLDPQISTMDLVPHCAQVNLSAAGITEVGDGTSSEEMPEADRRNLEDALEGECEPVPIID
jgi:hypothetical protein